eukprot:CAMPEP_0197022606 /NCGR_PEP_ID=MMETSP1384-20130603/3437_1 /TAXON_ID=29189 /ORGANISM="Ammonia sp." /LENGTH=106 /DNA_ID=CAMNT_0042450675 /DNA_START=39 /DNA_END=355 /DNA_ORIENTATION=+
MRSVLQCQSTGVVPRCTTSQSLPLVTFSLTLIITLTINICESANAEIGRPLTSNRALLAEFPLFLQHSQTGQVVAVEVDQTATIKQLYELAAETFGADSVQLRLGG